MPPITPAAGDDGPSGLGGRGAPAEYSNAIRVPSGDQRGVDSGPFAAVTTRAPPAAAKSSTAICPWPLASVVTNASRRPSGDHATSPSSHRRPGHAVIECTTAGFATSASRIALRSPTVSTYTKRRPSGESATWVNWCTPPSAEAI